MKKQIDKIYIQQKKRYLKKIVGTILQPRLSIFKSNKHIYGQIIDDNHSKTLVALSTLDKKIKLSTIFLNKKETAFKIGNNLALKALNKQINFIRLDRKNLYYHGIIKNFIDGIITGGLSF